MEAKFSISLAVKLVKDLEFEFDLDFLIVVVRQMFCIYFGSELRPASLVVYFCNHLWLSLNAELSESKHLT